MRRAQTSWLDCDHQFIQAIGFQVAVPAVKVSGPVSLFSQAAHSCPCSVSAITDSSALTDCISQLVSGGQSHGLPCRKILVLLTGVAFSLPVAQFRRLSPHVLLPISVCFSAPREEVEAIGNHIPSPGHRRCHLQKVGRKGNQVIWSQCREPLVPT